MSWFSWIPILFGGTGPPPAGITTEAQMRSIVGLSAPWSTMNNLSVFPLSSAASLRPSLNLFAGPYASDSGGSGGGVTDSRARRRRTVMSNA